MIISLKQLRDFDIETSVASRILLLLDNSQKSEVINRTYFDDYIKNPVPFSYDENDINKLNEIWNIKDCHICPLLRTKNKAYPNGNLNASIFVIGEAPGIGKLLDNIPDDFLMWAAGPSTENLKTALSALNILDHCWFSNLLRCSIPDNRPGNNDEFNNCFSKLKKEIELIGPKILLLLGNRVTSFVEQKKSELLGYKIIKIKHPAYYNYKGLTYEAYADDIKRSLKEAL